MKAHSAHPAWVGHLHERHAARVKAEPAPEIARDDAREETWGDEVGELAAGLRVFHRIVAEIRARRPDLPDYYVKQLAHGRLIGLHRPGEYV